MARGLRLTCTVMLTTLQRNLKWTISQAASLICSAVRMMINSKQMLSIMEASAFITQIY